MSRAALSTRTDAVIAGGMEMDQEELDVLTRQLTSQMEYNNLLLEHLQVEMACARVWMTNACARVCYVLKDIDIHR
eukprot:42922-Eustigmatos_ZCMA.PRE.1